MPLPDAGPLSLHVARPVQASPKRAMIVRMSAETLDALDPFPNHPDMSFDFGPNPGIYIGDAFFPMRPQKESSPHELYLRAASAAKPMAPLKLHANVVGKFMVERQLGHKVTDKVRHQALVAKQQHLERQAIFLDKPPIPLPAPKNTKRKAPASDLLRVPSSSRKVSPLPPASRASADVRRRLVHCIAMCPRLAEDAVKMVGGANTSDAARDHLLALLQDVAEQQPPLKKGDKSPRPWVLKTQSWTEVRPFDWPNLTEQERVTMARQARLAFKALKIPESDPAWDNVRFRQSGHPVPPPPPMTATTSRSSASAHAEPKRPAITKEAKLKSKQDSRPKGEIQVKDESSKATVARVDAIKRADRPSDGATASKTVASRRLPGSGYQAKKSPQSSTAVVEKPGTPVEARSTSKPSLPPKPSPVASSQPGASHARKTIPTVPPKHPKKEDESDDREYERQREREREKRAREKEKLRELEREQERAEREKARQREREAMEREKRQREKDREREAMEQEKRQREKELAARDKAAAKRKAPPQDAEDLDDVSSKSSLSKRRKLDDGSSSVASSSKAQDPGLPRKPVHESSPVPRLKMKKDHSPAQTSVSSQDRGPASGSAHKSERPSKASGGAKARRRSPIYTSSEDEGEIPQPRKRNPSPPPASDRSLSSDQPSSERAPRHHRPTRKYPPATDHAALRALYQSQYANYLGAFAKVVAQRRKIEAMLNGDSEAEMDVMDMEELLNLGEEYRTLKTELEHIHAIYTRGAAATET